MEEARTALAAEGSKTCSTCRFWSQWLSTTGDCMAYPYKRREAGMRELDKEKFDREWPAKAAHDTQADDTCNQWEAEDRR